jgi:hypothetical protein
LPLDPPYNPPIIPIETPPFEEPIVVYTGSGIRIGRTGGGRPPRRDQLVQLWAEEGVMDDSGLVDNSARYNFIF